MLIKNTTNRFGLIAILLHWIMAVLLIGLVALGLYMADMPISVQKLKYYGWHKEFGILALMLAIVRLSWRLSNTTPSLSNLHTWERLLARAAHYTFYFFMFALPFSGWLITSAANLPVSFFGWFTLPNLISASEPQRLFFTEVHEWLAYGLIATFCLHVAGAMKHFLIDRDDILQRILKP
jgi:cytochrome b561